MNSYELADYVSDNGYIGTDTTHEVATMLRQQADRIAELEKEVKLWEEADVEPEFIAETIIELEKRGFIEKGSTSSKPVAWWTGKFDDECEDFMFPDTRQAHIDHPQSETHNFFPIPLYTHPHKELSDEEIEKIMYKCDWSYDPVSFARAIIKASKGEE